MKNNFKDYANSFQAVTVPGLERISLMLNLLGNPEKNLRFIHVAGTNGKGSVSANVACILEDAGYLTGKYISPNLIKVNERISVNGKDISDEELKETLDRIEPIAAKVEEALGIAPTQFEIWTAAAFLYFDKRGCDFVVLEVGLGGEFDATNVIEKNEIAIITRLGIDHTGYLGSTIADIARAKAGIIKELSGTGAVVTLRQDGNANEVISEVAESHGMRLIIAEPTHVGTELCYERFSVGGISDILCGIAGYHQIENAALAVLAAKELGIAEEHIKIPQDLSL